MPASQAQELRYPAYQSTTLNDFEGLLAADAAARVDATLQRFRAEYGVEATVVTLAARGDYGPHRSLESFATGLFNDWGIGDATRNDGILFLTLTEDRQVRVELGAGYAPGWDRAAKDVVTLDILPAFGTGDFQAGIEAGLRGIEARILRPVAGGAKPQTPAAPPPAAADDGTSEPWPFVLMAIVFGVFTLRTRAGDVFARLRSCPNCGRRGGLRVARRVTSRASLRLSGSGIKTTTCQNCAHHEEAYYVIPRITRSASSSRGSGGGGGGFGGGSSSGGGASGRF